MTDQESTVEPPPSKFRTWWDKKSRDAKIHWMYACFTMSGFIFLVLGGMLVAYCDYGWAKALGIVLCLAGLFCFWVVQIGIEQGRKERPLPTRYVSPPVNQRNTRVRCGNCPATTMSDDGDRWVTMQQAVLNPLLVSYKLHVVHLCPNCRYCPGVEKLSHPRAGIHLRPVKDL